jgi:NAD-dependent DNA ligase
VVKGIVCDGTVNDAELVALKQWIASHSDVCVSFPGNVIAARLVAAFEDGLIDEAERADLLVLLQDTVGESEDQGGLLDRASRLPLDRPYPTMIFDAREFCFTGVFAYGTRARCEHEVIRRGGRCVSSPTTATRYVVIGLQASPAWTGSVYGRKVERAMRFREEGRPVAIVCEEHWVEAIGWDSK